VSFLLLEIVIVGRDLGVGVIVCVFSGMRDFTSRWIMASGLPDPKMLTASLGPKGPRPEFFGKRSGHIPYFGELNPDAAIQAISRVMGVEYQSRDPEYTKSVQTASKQEVISRPGSLCAGCPHRASYWAINRALKRDGWEGYATGDAGCMSAGFGPGGFYVAKIGGCMGGGAGMADGFGKLKQFGFTQPIIGGEGEEAESLFAKELEDSRKPLPADRAVYGDWRFAYVCAVTPERHVLGGVHLDIGPINFGPLAKEKLAFIEGVLVLPQYRRRGVGTTIMKKAVDVARNVACLHMRCNVRWDNLAGIALYRKCGFALTDITDEEGGEYFVVKPL
jgi:ribosomal protein S18 acetylase RimI-like enzyme